MSWPKRLKNTASRVSTATRESAPSRPRRASSRAACGRMLIPTPTGLSSGEDSNTREGMPAFSRASASASPPMPPPTIRTSMREPPAAEAHSHCAHGTSTAGVDALPPEWVKPAVRGGAMKPNEPVRRAARVAAVQPASFSGAEEHRNAAQACAYIDEAADAGASYVVFPEGYPGPYSGPMENDAVERVRER